MDKKAEFFEGKEQVSEHSQTFTRKVEISLSVQLKALLLVLSVENSAWNPSKYQKACYDLK